MVSSPRRFSLLGLGVVLVVWLCVTAGTGSRSGDDAVARAMAASGRLDSLIAHRPDSVRALTSAYLERARLGIGSPFRLIDQAVSDPRLDDSTGRAVAWAIVGRLLDHTAYEIDASVLDGVAPRGAGSEHLALIDHEIEADGDPRVGERVVRLAYGLAITEGAVSPTAQPVVVEVAAQRRDRALAARDLQAALARVHLDGGDLIDEIVAARARGEFEVERPLLSRANDDAGLDRVPRLLSSISKVVADTTAIDLGNRSLLPASLAPTVARLGARLPPQPSVGLSVRSSAALLRNDPSLLPSVREYLVASTNEESFVAAYAIANRFSDRRSIAANRAALSVAVSTRVLAQEPVWFPGSPAPTAGEVVGRTGLRAIEFDREIPSAWRPYFVRMVASSIEDVQRVLPAYDPRGLTIHFVTRSLPDSALAMHDPRGHALILSIATATGALAHELAHDLDWQSARRLFARGGGYATDRSARENGGRLSQSVRGLSASRSTGAGRTPNVSSRPAEVFARSVDWFVTFGLSSLGRSNGYLSTIQDPLLPGFAAGLNDAASLSAADALVGGLNEMTPVPDSIRLAYLDQWGDAAHLDPEVILARLRAAPIVRWRGAFAAVDASGMSSSPSCVLERLADGTPRDRFIAEASIAKARGFLRRRAESISVADRPAWAHAALGDPTWSRSAYDDLLRRTIAGVIEGAGRAGVGLAPAPFGHC
jgi:hypothetical protein